MRCACHAVVFQPLCRYRPRPKHVHLMRALFAFRYFLFFFFFFCRFFAMRVRAYEATRLYGAVLIYGVRRVLCADTYTGDKDAPDAMLPLRAKEARERGVQRGAQRRAAAPRFAERRVPHVDFVQRTPPPPRLCAKIRAQSHAVIMRVRMRIYYARCHTPDECVLTMRIIRGARDGAMRLFAMPARVRACCSQ